jgi:DNA-binding transcriptional LysR family regulator
MLQFRHEVFLEVARLQSFSKAAEALFLSQPAISKNIRSLEEWYQVTLFERKGNQVVLTETGRLLEEYVKKACELNRELEVNITGLKNKKDTRGSLVIGASTTVALYVIPKVLSAFHQKYPNIQLRLVNRNSENILKALLDQEIDFGIIEGPRAGKAVNYRFFISDEVVPVCSAKCSIAQKIKISLQELKSIPVALRERGSGTLAAVTQALYDKGIKMNELTTKVALGGTEALKNFLLYDACIGFLPLRSVSKELANGDLVRITITGLYITREFYFVQRHGAYGQKIIQSFIKIARQLYNKK